MRMNDFLYASGEISFGDGIVRASLVLTMIRRAKPRDPYDRQNPERRCFTKHHSAHPGSLFRARTGSNFVTTNMLLTHLGGDLGGWHC